MTRMAGPTGANRHMRRRLFGGGGVLRHWFAGQQLQLTGMHKQLHF